MRPPRLIRSFLVRRLRDHPRARRLVEVVRDRAATALVTRRLAAPESFRPRVTNLTIAVTAHCNLRCTGCRYGRDFMPGATLPLELLEPLFDDAQELGVRRVRLYGGEPLLHPDITTIVERAANRGLNPYVTTNATLLARRIDELWAAGLRGATIGLYGTGDDYDGYVGRKGAWRRFEDGLRTVRERYGDRFFLRLNWLLKRGTATRRHLDAALDVARDLGAPVQIDLVHYSLPYFTEGPDRELQFRPEDRPDLEDLAAHLVEIHAREPGLLDHSAIGLRAIPDWLLLGPHMNVPCDKHDMLWIGADGSVQLCYVTFPLGNLHETRLRDIVGTDAHVRAGRCALARDCPNCHCGYDSRTRTFAPTRAKYGG